MRTLRSALIAISSALLLLSCSPGSPEKKKDDAVKTSPTPEPKASKPAIAEPRASFDTLKDGDFTMRYPNGVIQMKGFYINGKREGEWAAFFPSGKIQSEGFFTHGKRDHQATVYFESGQKMYEGTYKEGVMVGKWLYYNTDGSLNHDEDYGTGKETSLPAKK